MDLQEVKNLLNTCEREELRDHAFGDAEVYWTRDGEEVAFGYFSGRRSTVGFAHQIASLIGSSSGFENEDACALRECGRKLTVSRIDETGPAEYQEGVIMPALTLDGVRQELMNSDPEG